MPAFVSARTGVPGATETVTVYRGATVIDGTGAAPKPNMAIVTRGERIEAIIPHRGAGRYAKDATTVDAGELYAIPGLIDSHVHLATAPNRRYAEALLRRDVYSGVTAVRDMAGDARFLADLSRAAMLGEIPAPDIAYAALSSGSVRGTVDQMPDLGRGRRLRDVSGRHVLEHRYQVEFLLVVPAQRIAGLHLLPQTRRKLRHAPPRIFL